MMEAAIAIDLLGVALESTQVRKKIVSTAMATALIVRPITVIGMVAGITVTVICMDVNVAATAVHPDGHIVIKCKRYTNG